MNIFPFYIKPETAFQLANQSPIFSNIGELLDPEENDIEIGFRTAGGGRITVGEIQATFSENFWNEVKAMPEFAIKVDHDGTRAFVSKRRFDLAPKHEVEIPYEDIIIQTTKLENVTFDPRLFQPITTGKYIDKFWSRVGGIMPATNIMITGDPGIGKSSNLMDILVGIQNQDPHKKVLYISAEMTAIDVQEFLQFYPRLEKIDFLFLGDYVTDPNQKIKAYQALQSTLDQGWDVVVIDSLYETQSMIQEDLNISSFKKGERYMLDLLNKHNSGHNKMNLFTSFLVIQQKNKSGQYVGSKRLEHMTTGFLQLCWDGKERGKRFMVFEKNRKGKEKVKLYYNLNKEKGIIYDEIRHTKEAEFLEILQQEKGLSIDEISESDFAKLFQEKLLDTNANE